jgi:predicted NACHT family NTPase
MSKSETEIHKRLKEVISEKLNEWTAISIQEYYDSGHELDIKAVTYDRITIYIEIVKSNMSHDMLMIHRSNANIKILVAADKKLLKQWKREYEKTAFSEIEKGFLMPSSLIDGIQMLEDNNFLELDFKKTLDDLIERTREKIKGSINLLFKKQKNKYEFIENYILRNVCSIKEYESDEFRYISDSISEDIIDIIRKEKYIALICDAGIGKTTELKRIAAFFSSDEENVSPFLISLNTYVNHDIKDLLTGNLEDIPEGQRLVILDGLDEIPSENKLNAYRNIEQFVNEYPQTRCIISSRTNFYSPESKDFSGTLKNFKTYVLNDLDYKQIDNYINEKLENNTRKFLDLIQTNNLQDLLKIPFYLVHFTELYSKNLTLPTNKADILYDLIRKRVESDIEKFRTTSLSFIESNDEILESLDGINRKKFLK